MMWVVDATTESRPFPVANWTVPETRAALARSDPKRYDFRL